MSVAGRFLLVSALLGVLMVQGFSGVTAQERSLLAIARPVASTQGWFLGEDGSHFGGDYFWLSDHEILYFRNVLSEEERIVHLPNGALTAAGRWLPHGGTAIRYNLQTQSETPLTAVSARFDKEHGLQYSVQVSPDGAWIYWAGDGGSHVTSLQTARDYQAPALYAAVWTIDDRLAGFPSGGLQAVGEVDLYSVGQTKWRERYALRDSPFEDVLLSGLEKQVTADRRLLTTDWIRTHDEHIKIEVTRLSRDRITSRSYPLTLPRGAVIRSIRFSPGGDRVALLLKVDHEAVGKPTVTRWSLFTSRVDGAHCREIGSLETEDEDARDTFHWLDDQHRGYGVTLGKATLDNLHWLPDGHRLSFVYHDALYTIPTD